MSERLGPPPPLGARQELDPVLLRLQATGHASPELVRRVEALGSRVEALPARSLVQAEDAPVRRPRYLTRGWACRYRHLPDGRRQIFDLVLPGEGVGVCLRPHPLANTTTAAITPVRLVDAGPLLSGGCDDVEGLHAALQMQADIDERRMLNQIVRLGRLSALERITHLFLELHERLALVGEAEDDRFPLPLTQETLADIAGLSVVHVNRTLQELRRQDLAKTMRGWVLLPDAAALARAVGYEPEAVRSKSA